MRVANPGDSACKKGRQSARFPIHEVLAMAFRRDRFRPLTAALPIGILAGALACALPGEGHAQVFVVGEKTAMADVSTDFHPTRVELPSTPITERGRRELVRYLEAEQGFAHRTLPLGDDITLMANGNLTPGGDAYKVLLYKKGESAQPGDRVVITTVTVKADRMVFEGGIPDISAPEVKALLDPIIDFGVKTGSKAYADTLTAFLKKAVAHQD